MSKYVVWAFNEEGRRYFHSEHNDEWEAMKVAASFDYAETERNE